MSEPIKMTAGAQEQARAVADKLSEWGIMRVLHGVALALVVIGLIAPVASFTSFGLFSSGTSAVNLLQLGMGGWILGVVSVGLAAAPFALVISKQMAIALFGLACLVLGLLLMPFFVSGYGGAFAQLSFGYYALFGALGVLVYAYWRRIGDEMQVQLDLDRPL